jgi:hypothetical protein
MKKYLKVVFVFLLVVLTIEKNVFASGTVLTKEQAAYYLENTKGFIAELIMAYNKEEEYAKRERAERNLRGVANHPATRPIVEQAFNDAEQEGKTYKAPNSWWNKLFAIRKTYLGR